MALKETYYSTKRELLWHYKRPIIALKETYYGTIRDLARVTFVSGKRPSMALKETYYGTKRDLVWH